MELVYILTVTDDDGEVLFYPVTVVAAIVNLVRNWNRSLKLVKISLKTCPRSPMSSSLAGISSACTGHSFSQVSGIMKN